MLSTDAAQDILSAIGERVRFARRRFGNSDVIDFVAVLLGYARSFERTLEAFYKRLHPFAPAFMALFGRERLPSRSTLSRFLASLTQPRERGGKLLAQRFRQRTPAMAAGRTNRRWTVREVLSYPLPPVPNFIF